MRHYLEQRETMPRLIDLNQTLEDAIELTVPAGRPDMQVARQLTPGLPPVLVDPGQLRQALVNLIRGAMDAATARDDAAIRVATHHVDDHVAVVVEANGAAHHSEAASGIPAALDDGHVNGRDLAIARAIAQDHGGDLVVDVGERERGTRFTLRLPVPARVSAQPA